MRPEASPEPIKGQPRTKQAGPGCVLLLAGVALLLSLWGAWTLYKSQRDQVVAVDYEIPLPGGYKLVRDGYKARIIVDAKGVTVLGPDVTGLALAGPFYVAGELAEPGEQMRAWPAKGRFLIDTRTGVAQTGLSIAGLAKALKANGAPEPPDLLPPARFLETLPGAGTIR
jgi:hypothetical protein